ncbi:sensor domain-containing phosphodiesterase [Ensifer soli]|uniref:sensor domain-containing phosphodiesterase n=1 Tax=Ciceribacter sp. sgz301302 TaxID=3342379 RepID=UPI0035BC77A8
MRALDGFEIAGTAPEPRFDRIARLARSLFQAPIVFISLVGRERQWLKSRVGLELEETARSISFCDHTIRSDEVMVVADASQDPRFSENPFVTQAPFVRFYAGAPLIAPGGQRLGALCILDTQPRASFDRGDRDRLQEMAALVMDEIERRRAEMVRRTVMGFADANAVSLLAINAEGRITFVNRAATQLFGYGREDMIGRPLDIIIPERLRGAHRDGVARVAGGVPSKLSGKTVELVALRRDGTEFPIELSLSTWTDEHGIGIGAMIRDITERRERDARLLRLAHHDPLTGLINRLHFEDLVVDAVAQASNAAVLLVDIDHFNEVNGSFGHDVGDSLLQAVAVRLPTIFDGGVMIGRFTGDEFAILLSGVGDPATVRAVAGRVLRAFDEPFEFGGNVFHVTASVGCAVAPFHGSDGEELIASADLALYRAKQAGGRSAFLFEPEMRNATALRRATQDELLRALQHNDLRLFYQPQVSLTEGRVIGMEALIRWQHPERGLLLPATFLPALEESSLALPIGWWVLDEACRQMARWRDAGRGDIRVGVNLFAAQFRSGNLAQHVTDTLSRHDLKPEQLELEVTETIALHKDDLSLAAIRELREIGVRIAFDDFGTGYASLSSLQRFPLTTLKIDRRFVRDLISNPQDAAITRAMLSMGTDLGLETIAEGIETVEQEQVLKLLGCRCGQGYLYGKPVPADEALADLTPPSARPRCATG